MFLWPLLLLVRPAYSILVGTILNVTYQSNDSIPVIFNGTCQQCMCQAFIFNTSSTYAAFNCYANENKCNLFYNYSISYQLVANASSQFYFYPDLPPLITLTTSSITTASTILTTSNSFQFRWNSTGTTVAGITNSAGTAANQLATARSLALYSSNILYVVDKGNSRVQKWIIDTPNATTTVAGLQNGTLGPALNQLNLPSGVAFDSSGNIYVADAYNHRVVFWAIGAFSGMIVAGNGIAGNSSNQLNTPVGCAYDSNSDTLYVADTFNHRIMQYAANASSGIVVAGGNGQGYSNIQLNTPKAVYFDSPSSSLYIANAVANNVVRWILNAISWTLVAGSISGSAGITPTLLNTPLGVTLDSLGNVYVADSTNNRIQFYLAGQTNGTTIAGVTSIAGNSSSLLNGPSAVAVDSQFNLYVADSANVRVQKFSPY